MLDVATELDLALVPGFESDIRCESEHLSGSECSTEVTCRVTYDCGVRPGVWTLACESVAKRVHAAHASRITCRRCGKPTLDCWKVVPV